MNLAKPICHAAKLILAVMPLLCFADSATAGNEATGCRAFVERGTLSVLGDDTANDIEIVGTAEGVQLKCDGATATYSSVEEIIVEAREGDDQITTDNRNGLLSAIAIRLFGQGGNDGGITFLNTVSSQGEGPPHLPVFGGGIGLDVLQVVAGSQADRFEIRQGADAGSVEVRVNDVASETPLAHIAGLALEFLSIKAGDGDDEFHVAEVLKMGLTLFGEGGNDRATEQIPLNFEEIDFSYVRGHDGGSGKDKFNVLGASAHEQIAISGVIHQEFPDPRIRVMDLATGLVIGDFFVQQTEEIAIASGGGDDHLDVQWEAASMSGLEKLEVDLGDDDDTMAVNLLPVLVAPPTDDVQRLLFDVDTGRGDDRIAFHHSAGSWFDVVFTARLGAGHDRSQTILFPPPDDGLPGPEGVRRLEFEVAAGNEDDFVGIRNEAGDVFFALSFGAELGRGDDFLEAAGEMALVARPGRGFDTARVTRNLLPFVTEFEQVLEGP